MGWLFGLWGIMVGGSAREACARLLWALVPLLLPRQFSKAAAIWKGVPGMCDNTRVTTHVRADIARLGAGHAAWSWMGVQLDGTVALADRCWHRCATRTKDEPLILIACVYTRVSYAAHCGMVASDGAARYDLLSSLLVITFLYVFGWWGVIVAVAAGGIGSAWA